MGVKHNLKRAGVSVVERLVVVPTVPTYIVPTFFQKMEVLRQDVEAMEKEMDELRAYLAETDEQQKEGNIAIDDDVECMEEGTAVHVKELV